MVAECPECGKKTLFKYEKRSGDRVRIMVKCAHCGYDDELDSYIDKCECEDEDDEEDEDDDE